MNAQWLSAQFPIGPSGKAGFRFCYAEARARNPPSSLAVEPAVCLFAGRYMPVARDVSLMLDRAGASFGRALECQAAGDFAARIGRKSSASGAAMSGIFTRVSKWNYLVRGNLLLDFQYHASIRRPECCDFGRPAVGILPRDGVASWFVRATTWDGGLVA